VEAANRRHHEGYVFGGKLSDLEPYAVTRDANGDITAVTARPGIDEPITRMVGERPATFPITGPGVFAGGGDLFQTLIDLRDALLADDGAAVTAAAAALELIEHNVVDSQARLGSFTNRLDAAIEALESGQLRLEAERSRLLDADMADAALRLTTEETLYQAALEMAARVSELSLVNYL
jgi:flagellar hook-associated protein 3 FlgL